MLQPICGYVLDVLGLKMGFAIFAISWSLVNMAHSFAGSWQAFAWLRGLLGFAEGSANPAGMKATADWFPAEEQGLAGGVYNIGASVGSMLAPLLVAWATLAYNWRAAFVITGSLGLVWVVLWLLLYQSPDRHPALSEKEKSFISSGQEKHLQSDGSRPSLVKILGQRNFWGIALPRFLADPDPPLRDLVHWRLLTRPLNRASQLNMLGDPDSCGIWAPCLSYADGLCWLIYTDVKRYGRTTQGGATGASLRDTHNYLVTSPRIDGEWSDPVYLNSSGFDPSLFHDDDGRKYLVNMRWDHRPGCNRFSRTVLQEYSPAERKLVGPVHPIFQGTPLGFTEGPHLYKRHGYYYLLTAEGGTGWGHAVTMARSRELRGPYELHPDVYILTARNRPDIELQRSGHADLVETPQGETYMVHLCGRPMRNRGRCTLGRETAIQPMVWSEDGWLRTVDGAGVPYAEVATPALLEHVFPGSSDREDFDSANLPLDSQWLRSLGRRSYSA
jgi:hypothetical protein